MFTLSPSNTDVSVKVLEKISCVPLVIVHNQHRQNNALKKSFQPNKKKTCIRTCKKLKHYVLLKPVVVTKQLFIVYEVKIAFNISFKITIPSVVFSSQNYFVRFIFFINLNKNYLKKVGYDE